MTFDTNNLNRSQRLAVDHDDGHLLITAGPGTGKTHTLTRRIARLVSRLSPGEKILTVTFTNKAADEMRARLIKRLGADLGRVEVGTFHSFCLNVLRESGERIGLPSGFRVASDDDINAAVKALWPDTPPRERKVKMEAIAVWKGTSLEGQEPDEVRAYNRCLRRLSLLDFDDLLRETLKLFEKEKDAPGCLQKTYRFVCVDEYQDINAIQHVLLKRIVGDRGLVTAIGDPNQAIYGFRGSDVRFFESFRDDFPRANVMELSENYRSTENLLKASGQIIRKGSFPVPELTARIYKQGRLIIRESPSEKAEAEYVVHSIEKIVGGTSMFSRDSGRVASDESADRSFADIAVLYRLNSQRRILEEAFGRSGIPYQVSGETPFEESVDFTPPTAPPSLKYSEAGGAGRDSAPTETLRIKKRRDAGFTAFGRASDKPWSCTVEKVNLMTLHAAKGLEFPVVFIVGCEEKLIPLQFANFQTDPAEERRLFYVGMTRAREWLFLVHSKRRMLYGQTLAAGPSSFLKDIEEDLKSFDTASPPLKRNKKRMDTQMSLFE